MTKLAALILFLLTSIFSFAECGPSPRILSSSEVPLLDEKVSLEVVGLAPFQVVMVEVSWVALDHTH